MVKNGGTDYRPKGDPWRVNVHYFEDKKLGKVVPCGVYDMTTNAGFVSVGIISDTAEFVVRSIPLPARAHGRSEAHNDRKFQPRLSGDRLEWAGSLSNWFSAQRYSTARFRSLDDGPALGSVQL